MKSCRKEAAKVWRLPLPTMAQRHDIELVCACDVTVRITYGELQLVEMCLEQTHGVTKLGVFDKNADSFAPTSAENVDSFAPTSAED